MIEDVYEPLARYRDEFKAKFASLAREKFRRLTERSGVDIDANRALVGVIKNLQQQARRAGNRKTFFCVLMTLAFVGAGVALVWALAVDGFQGPDRYRWIAGVLAGCATGVASISPFRSAAELLEKLEARIAAKKAEAWAQMEPLNRLYTWDIPVRLIEATVPKLQFDPYFTAERLEDLHRQFGWDDSFNAGKSMIFAQSGVINGNPFAFGHYLDMEWGEKTYEGTLRITWTEWEEDSDGKRRRVYRHQTLHAYVKKPIPVYSEQKFLVYGNDAAPNLTFSREPSGLTGKENELMGKLRKNWRLSRLKAYSRNLKDESNFTLMGNHEFETWFHAKDRDDEVEFRLLFTPVAQRQMLDLMKDHAVGYGDDFVFLKQCKINLLFSQHLDEGTISTDPAQFRNWDFDEAESFFMAFNERYFKDVYFAMAPLLSIPLYQQTRTHEEIWKDVLERKASAFWEHEAVANYHGEKRFEHPRCVTRSILKTNVVERKEGESTIAVTAHGFEGVERTDYKSVYGDDGDWHDVPVKWIEYLPVQRTSNLCLSELEKPSEQFRRLAAESKSSAFRRSILSFPAVKAMVAMLLLCLAGLPLYAKPMLSGQYELTDEGRVKLKVLAHSHGIPPPTPAARTRVYTRGSERRTEKVYDETEVAYAKELVGMWRDKQGNEMRLARPDRYPWGEGVRHKTRRTMPDGTEYYIDFNFAEQVSDAAAERLLKDAAASLSDKTTGMNTAYSAMKWWTAENDHYKFMTDLDKAKGGKFVTDTMRLMEAMRKSYEFYVPPKNKVGVCTVRVFKSKSGYDEYLKSVDCDMEWSIGLWSPAREELLVTAEDRQQALNTMRHEAFHQYLHYAVEGRHATWFNEGHACFFENVKYNSAQNTVKITDQGNRAKAVDRNPQLYAAHIRKVLGMSRDEFYGGDQTKVGLNYCTAWALVYFLEKGAYTSPSFEAYRNILPKYLELVAGGMDALEATKVAWQAVQDRDVEADFLKFWKEKRKAALNAR